YTAVNITFGNCINKLRITACTVFRNAIFRFYRGHYFLNELRKMSQFYIVASPFNSAAARMSQNQNKLYAGHCSGIFQASENARGDDVACNADAENIAQSLVKNQLCRCAAVHTAEYCG